MFVFEVFQGGEKSGQWTGCYKLYKHVSNRDFSGFFVHQKIVVADVCYTTNLHLM